jgi:Bifunctional DNA primase/polymerase, N-terminal
MGGAEPPAAALAHGLAVFPIPPGARGAPPGWQRRASRHPDQPWPAGSNIGVGCRASGIVVLDLDRKNGVDGVATLAVLGAAHDQPWPATFTVATAHGGLHLYFRAPTRVVVNTIGILGPGIDVRAPGRMSGGYVLGPGSTVDGHSYAVARNLPIAATPDWLVRLLCPPTSVVRRVGTKTGDVQVMTTRTPQRSGPPAV